MTSVAERLRDAVHGLPDGASLTLSASAVRSWLEAPETPPEADHGRDVPDTLVRAADVAETLDVSKDRVYALAREDRIPHVRVGRSVRFSPRAVRAWIEDGGQDLPGGWRTDPEA